jgi:hypothetical protein
VKEGEEESREGKVPDDCGTVTTKAVSDRKKMPEDDENILSASSLTSPSESSLSSEQTAERNVVKEGEEGRREGKVAKTDVLKIKDCDTVTTKAISDRKK